MEGQLAGGCGISRSVECQSSNHAVKGLVHLAHLCGLLAGDERTATVLVVESSVVTVGGTVTEGFGLELEKPARILWQSQRKVRVVA